MKGTQKCFCTIAAIRFRGRSSANLLVSIQARTPGDTCVRGKGDGGFCCFRWLITYGVRTTILELDVLYYLKLSGDHVVLKSDLFSYSIQATTTDTQLLFFRQIMFHSNMMKLLGGMSRLPVSLVCSDTLISVVGLMSQVVSTLLNNNCWHLSNRSDLEPNRW